MFAVLGAFTTGKVQGFAIFTALCFFVLGLLSLAIGAFCSLISQAKVIRELETVNSLLDITVRYVRRPSEEAGLTFYNAQTFMRSPVCDFVFRGCSVWTLLRGADNHRHLVSLCRLASKTCCLRKSAMRLAVVLILAYLMAAIYYLWRDLAEHNIVRVKPYVIISNRETGYWVALLPVGISWVIGAGANANAYFKRRLAGPEMAPFAVFFGAAAMFWIISN